jgi:hypothetical protein
LEDGGRRGIRLRDSRICRLKLKVSWREWVLAVLKVQK